MLKLDRTPLHWKTYKLLARLCELSGIDWTARGPQSWRDGFDTNHTEARRLSRLHGVTVRQAAAALRRNNRWHDLHPARNNRIRLGDIPF